MDIASTVAAVAMTVGVTGGVFAVFMLRRNDWVFRQRYAILNDPTKTVGECLSKYERLAPYDAMLARFWVWDVEKFLTPQGLAWDGSTQNEKAPQ